MTTIFKDIKLFKQQNTGNSKNICIYFNKGLKNSKALKKKTKN